MSGRVFGVIAIAALLLVGVGAAAAAPMWNGAGWHQIEDLDVIGGIHAAPFADEAACKATLPPDDDEAIYYCEYLETRPAWDA